MGAWVEGVEEEFVPDRQVFVFVCACVCVCVVYVGVGVDVGAYGCVG